MRDPVINHRCKRSAALLLSLVLAAALLLPLPARAHEGAKTVRVGWYESPFNITDPYGRRFGYAYEYERKLAAYTGWHYEYVEGTWSELMDKLRRGEIDLMSDVSYLEERTREMLYSALPMGTESYYVYAAPGATEITSDHYASLDGKRVGVTKNSVQRGLFLKWEELFGVHAQLVELTSSEEESLQMLKDGQLDAFVTLNVYGDPETAVPLWKIGSSDFFFALNRDREDLLTELNEAMDRIMDENGNYAEQLTEKYLRSSAPNRYLSREELAWLESHGPIRVGYQDNYLAFCASDASGALTGALKEYLEVAANGPENASLSFEAIAYPTAAEAMGALNSGEVDCVFPANLTDYDSEALGVVMTPALMRTEMYAVVRASEQQSFFRKGDVTVAVNQGNPNYELFLLDHYPGWLTAHYADTPACLGAVAAGKADCIIISNYRFSNIERQCEKLHLATVSTGVDMDYCFAVREGDTALYSILARVNGTVPASAVHAALSYYSSKDARTSLIDNVRENLALVSTIVATVALVIMLLLLRSIRAEKKADEEEHLVNDLNKRVYRDALTSVRNKGAFAHDVQKLQDRLDRGERPAFAIGVFDCDDLKTINDRFGHDKGDEYLKAACWLICKVYANSPVYRIGGDEFAVVLQDADYENRDALAAAFEAAQREACDTGEDAWDRVSVALGIAVNDPQIDRAAIDTARRADKIMYENKRRRKQDWFSAPNGGEAR